MQRLSFCFYRYSELATEEQSALLVGEKPGSAGTAIVSVSTATPSIHLLLIFTGVFTGEDTNNAPVSVKLHSPDGKDIIHEVLIYVYFFFILYKPNYVASKI